MLAKSFNRIGNLPGLQLSFSKTSPPFSQPLPDQPCRQQTERFHCCRCWRGHRHCHQSHHPSCLPHEGQPCRVRIRRYRHDRPVGRPRADRRALEEGLVFCVSGGVDALLVEVVIWEGAVISAGFTIDGQLLRTCGLVVRHVGCSGVLIWGSDDWLCCL